MTVSTRRAFIAIAFAGFALAAVPGIAKAAGSQGSYDRLVLIASKLSEALDGTIDRQNIRAVAVTLAEEMKRLHLKYAETNQAKVGLPPGAEDPTAEAEGKAAEAGPKALPVDRVPAHWFQDHIGLARTHLGEAIETIEKSDNWRREASKLVELSRYELDMAVRPPVQ